MGSKPAIVLVHGFWGGAAHWSKVIVELARRYRGTKGFCLVDLTDPDLTSAALCRLLDNATLIVPAFGYRAATVPVFDCDGRRLALRADQGGPAVGRDTRLLLATGGSIANIFGIGLGTGFQPWGEMGGEADLKSQTNSLWLYQNHIGGLLYRGVEECLNAGNAGRAQRHRHDNQAQA